MYANLGTDSVWRNYREELRGFLHRRTGDPHVAEDLVQEVLLRAHLHGDQLRDPASMRAWLYGIARKLLIDHLRSLRPTETLPADLADASPDLPMLATEALAACLPTLAGHLPEADRVALQMTDLQNGRQSDAASQLGLSLSGLKSRVQRARRKLRDSVLACCRLETDGDGAITDFEARGTGCCQRCAAPR